MIKKLFGFITFIIVIIAAGGGYFLYKERRQAEQKHQEAKAPEVNITLIEGWTVEDIAKYLNDSQLAKAGDFLNAEKTFNASEYPILKSKPTKADLQGFLFPDTYRIYKPTSINSTSTSGSVINKALTNFSQKFTPVMESQAKKRGMTVYEIITLASIIEKETGRSAITEQQKQGLDAERKIIAGIFTNRLSIGMALESDATINYITKKSDPSATTQDTKIDSPYNTYLYKDLPPGPICNPSLSSIMAALYPQDTNYMYFLHDQTTGKAYYAETYEQHLANKQKYLK